MTGSEEQERPLPPGAFNGSAFDHPEYLWVNGERLECIDLWEDTKDGRTRGGYVVVKADGTHWAIDYGNPRLGLTQKGQHT